VTATLEELPGKGYEKVLDRDGVVLFRKGAPDTRAVSALTPRME
jgi:hypothetical protein